VVKTASQALAFIWGTVLCFILNIVDMKAAMGAGIVFVLWRLGFLELSFGEKNQKHAQQISQAFDVPLDSGLNLQHQDH